MGTNPNQQQRQQQQQHFLVVAYGVQGHINPARFLARRLVQVTGSLATLSVPISAHGRMFPSISSPDEEVSDGVISYAPFSDGYDDGNRPINVDDNHRRAQFKIVGAKSLSAIIDRFEKLGKPVTCVVHTLILPWVADLAHDHGLPAVLYWNQPATVLATYYHYYHGYEEVFASHADDPMYELSLPKMPTLRIRDLPSFVVDTTNSDTVKLLLGAFRQLFKVLEQEQKVIVYSFDDLETQAIKALSPELELFTVGPMLPVFDTETQEEASTRIHLFHHDERSYMQWLDVKPAKSVVYVSFGSLTTVPKPQLRELLSGLEKTKRPYLWVVRKDNRNELVELEEEVKNGLVVEWCDQVRVFSHPSVGCFVTHCGWNSTLEAVTCGVPMVAMPQWSDQYTNAWLVEKEWRVGVRAEVNREKILVAEELVRCVEMVMGDEEINKNAGVWKEKAGTAAAEGGSAERNLRDFVNSMQVSKNDDQE